jgi:hypothetical protein
LKKHISLSKGNHLYWKWEHLANCFPVKIELGFEGILLANDSFQVGVRLILFQIGLFIYVEETHVSFQRKRSV